MLSWSWLRASNPNPNPNPKPNASHNPNPNPNPKPDPNPNPNPNPNPDPGQVVAARMAWPRWPRARRRNGRRGRRLRRGRDGHRWVWGGEYRGRARSPAGGCRATVRPWPAPDRPVPLPQLARPRPQWGDNQRTAGGGARRRPEARRGGVFPSYHPYQVDKRLGAKVCSLVITPTRPTRGSARRCVP